MWRRKRCLMIMTQRMVTITRVRRRHFRRAYSSIELCMAAHTIVKGAMPSHGATHSNANHTFHVLHEVNPFFTLGIPTTPSMMSRWIFCMSKLHFHSVTIYVFMDRLLIYFKPSRLNTDAGWENYHGSYRPKCAGKDNRRQGFASSRH